MDEQTKKEEIKETVNKLYALRAGLSLVDKECDKANEIDEENKNENILVSNKRIKEIESENRKEQEKIKSISCKIENENKQLEIEHKKQLQKYNDLVIRYDKTTETRKTNITIFIIISAILLILLAIFISLLMMEMKTENFSGEHEFLYGVMIMSGILSVVALLLDFYALIQVQASVSERKSVKKQLENRTIPQPPNQKSLENDPSFMDIQKIIDNNIELAEKIKKESQQRTFDSQKRVNLISQNALEMYNLIVKEFYDILPNLDQRDYKNVDLIIYLLETGRAETMKEALQQVDAYISTEKIVQAISHASSTISQSIKANMQSIRETIKATSYELGNKIDRLTYNVNSMSDRQSALISELNENITKTNSSIEMQNALFEKANVSSAKMAENVEQMRLYADDAYIKNVNKW